MAKMKKWNITVSRTTTSMACQNCDWQGTEAAPIVDYHQRVDDGEPAPAGECPECGALCHALAEGEQTHE